MNVATQTIIEGKNIEVTQPIKEHVELKLEKVFNHFDHLIKNHEVKVILSVVKKKKGENQKVEVTINLNKGHVIRCEDSEENVYTAIDQVISKIERQLKKYKTRIYSKIHHGKSIKDFGIDEASLEQFKSQISTADLEQGAQDYSAPKIIKNKRFKMEPLDPDVAIEKLEDTGHPFYMFLNIFSNKIACVYKRDDGDYALIEPEFLEVNN